MLQNLDDENYTQEATQNLEGTTATNTNAEANNYSGFTAQTFSQSIITADGSTVITIYYDRRKTKNAEGKKTKVIVIRIIII